MNRPYIKEEELKEDKIYLTWFPQVPCEPFYVEVEDFKDAERIHSILAGYDFFQLDHNIKPDFSNACDVISFYEGEWLTHFNEDGQDFSDYQRNS